MGHYFINDDSLESNEKTIKVNVIGQTFKFITNIGVFSKDYLDYGTKLLIEQIVEHSNLDGPILDVGCGYGGLGLVVASQTDQVVTMVDVNYRAIDLCIRNSDLNNISNVEVFESDIYDGVDKIYRTIITNPPIRAGKDVVHEIILKAYDYLDDKGELFLVIKKQHGAKSAIKALEGRFSEVITLKKDKGYFIIKSKK